MRLKSMTIKNFKGIGEQGVTINFAPITMLFGPNNAGKSTIIQSLHLAREVFCEHQPDFDRVAIYGKGMNLGAFRDYVHTHDIDKVVRIKLDWDDVTIPPSSAALQHLELDNILEIDDLTYDISSMGIEISIAWNYALEKAMLKDFTLYFNGKEFTTIEIMPQPDLKSGKATNKICLLDPFISEDVKASILESAKTANDGVMEGGYPENPDTPHHTLDDRIPDMVGPVLFHFINMQDVARYFDVPSNVHDVNYTIEFLIGDTFVPQWGQYLNLKFNLNGEPTELYPDDTSEVITLYSNELFTRLISMTGKLAQNFLNKLLYIGPMREIPTRGAYRQEKPTHDRWATGLAAWDEIAKANDSQIEMLNEALEVLGLGHKIESKHELSYSIGKEKVSAIKNVFESSEMEFETIYKELEKNNCLNGRHEKYEFLKYVGLAYSFFENRKAFIKTTRIMLRCNKTDVEVEPQDMGLGVSQVVPFVAAAVLAKKDAFIAVEQPELHIHPKLQVNLGDIIINAALQSENTPIFLIETHSEHLLLRILRRIRQTDEQRVPAGLGLTPEQVIINWIGSKDKQTYCLHLEIDEDGSFITPWPEGFFDERGEEVFG